MDSYDSVDKRLSALAEWLKSSGSNSQGKKNVDFDGNKLYQNHGTYYYNPYNKFDGHPYNRHPRERTTFTESHLQVLEECFNEVKHPNSIRREKLAIELGLPVKTIQIWFQNRRARERKFAKKNGQGKNNECESISGVVIESEWCLNESLGSTDLVAINQRPSTYELESIESATSADGLESSTTVQELNSSLGHKIETNLDPKQQNGPTNKATFTIIHIPESKQIAEENKNNSVEPFSFTTTTDRSASLSIPQTRNQTTLSLNELADQQMIKLVENIDLDLIVETYKVLQSSDNADALIKNWLTNCEDNGPTLEENLREFVQFCQESKSTNQKQ